MIYYLYRMHTGRAELSPTPLPPALYPNHTLVRTVDSSLGPLPDVSGSKFNDAGELVPDRRPPTPDEARAKEYPSVQAQLDMIWTALGALKGKPWPAEVQAMIDQMAAVDAKHPKSN